MFAALFQLRFYGLFLIFYASTVLANVEKTIFVGPKSLVIPTEHPTLDDLQLHALSPKHAELRTELHAAFPSVSSERGSTAWVLLYNLIEGRRYELRICWAATQPTSFGMETYELQEVFATPHLIQSLATYSEWQLFEAPLHPLQKVAARDGVRTGEQSVLLVQINATADYYTTDQALMQNVPPVLVDMILDPYVLNIFPKSLIPTAYYLIAVAVIGWYVARYATRWLKLVARTDDAKKQL